MNYFQADNLTKIYAEKVLFRDISFGIDQGQKTGLIARNGAGKSTLIKIMMGWELADSGNCNFRRDIRVACLDQNPVFDPEPTVMDTLLAHDSPSVKALRNYTAFLRATEDDHTTAPDQDKLNRLLIEMDHHHAWDLDAKIKQILSQLKIENPDQPVGQLSGGQLKRVALARILVDEADFIILDEPTNHLDLQMIEWLEDYLARQKLTLLLVTHDRYFLDNVCNDIMELDGGNIYRYRGNYAYYLEKKEEREAAMAASTERARNQLRKETDWMRRQPQARTTKSKARIDAYYKLKDEAQKVSDKGMQGIVMQTQRVGKKILELEHVSKRFGEKTVINDFSYIFKKNEKVGVVGLNGTGKTTLLNIITQKLHPDSGLVSTGETIQYGYFTQDDLVVDDNKRVIDVITDIAETVRVGKGEAITASQFLFYFQFPHATQNDFVHKLSGGERRRLHLVTILMRNPNFLILDEPTNDLDIATLNVLESFLEDFPGCVLVVSHDRYFLDSIAEHTFVFEGNGQIKDFPGNYTEYRQKMAELKLSEKQVERDEKAKNAPQPVTTDTKTKLTFKERKEFEQLEAEIAKLEEQKSDVLHKMNSGTLSPEDLVTISHQYNQLCELLEEKENRWLDLSQWA